MKEVTYRDLPEMVSAAVKNAVDHGPFNDENEVEIVVQDEDGNEYNIQDIKFDFATGTVVIRFDHDNVDHRDGREDYVPDAPEFLTVGDYE